ncbi:MAG TPA: TMEM175 family protein, partial [Saprospiraceae bacterium]|nr:TMEM175 family protein [Saprospiraceae bacterium]
VLELITGIHAQDGEGLIQKFLNHWQYFLAFTIGFITILVCWINHHVAFEYIRKTDNALFWINGSVLFMVTLTPFPTAVLAEYLDREGNMALAVFGLNYILISVAADSLCSYAYHHHYLDEADRDWFKSYKLIYRYAIFFNSIAFLLCFVSMVIPIILYCTLFVVFAAPKYMATRLYRMRQKKTG